MNDAELAHFIRYDYRLDTASFQRNLNNLAATCSYPNLVAMYKELCQFTPKLQPITDRNTHPGIATKFFDLGLTVHGSFGWAFKD